MAHHMFLAAMAFMLSSYLIIKEEDNRKTLFLFIWSGYFFIHFNIPLTRERLVISVHTARAAQTEAPLAKTDNVWLAVERRSANATRRMLEAARAVHNGRGIGSRDCLANRARFVGLDAANVFYTLNDTVSLEKKLNIVSYEYISIKTPLVM